MSGVIPMDTALSTLDRTQILLTNPHWVGILLTGSSSGAVLFFWLQFLLSCQADALLWCLRRQPGVVVMQLSPYCIARDGTNKDMAVAQGYRSGVSKLQEILLLLTCSMCRVWLKGLHGFEISRHSAAKGETSAPICLSAIFWNIDKKYSNHVQAFRSCTLHSSSGLFRHYIQF